MPAREPYELWNQADAEHPADDEARRARYLELMRAEGHVLAPGDEGYEQASRELPCGWRP